MKVLDGIRVVDLSRAPAGPRGARSMADFGAGVIRVEAPGGDENRGWPPHGPDGRSANFASVNRGKRSVVLDLKTTAARSLLLHLVADADVLIPMLEARFAAQPVAHWVERFEARSVAGSPLHTVDQVMAHPQVLANAMHVTARDADGVDRALVETPFKLAEGAFG